MTKYALLLGYGIFNRAKVSKAKYIDYVKSFVSYVNKNKIDAIIISGGHTSLRHPLESEAKSIEKYLKPLLKRNVDIFLECWALTTLENIEFSQKFINLENNTVTVFCDNVRSQKVIWLVLHFWFGLSKKQIERYFIKYSIKYYVTNLTDEGLGKEMSKGFVYKNVIVKPYPMRVNIDDAISAITGDLMEINSIYEDSLRARLTKFVKLKLGLIN